MLNPDEMDLDTSTPSSPTTHSTHAASAPAPPTSSSQPKTPAPTSQSTSAPDTNINTKSKPPRGYEITSKTIKTPPFSYLCLELISSLPSTNTTSLHTNPSTKQPTLDPLTARTHLTSALTQFLGLTGSSISIDILKIDSGIGAGGDEVWIRVPSEDLSPVLAAVGGWTGRGGGNRGGERVGWRVRGKGSWLGGVVAGVGEGGVWRD